MTSYSVRADKDYESGKLRYYEATTTVEVAIGSLAALGMTIDSALAAGATEIKSLDFLADSLEPLRARLLARLGGVVDHGRMSVKHVRPEDAC